MKNQLNLYFASLLMLAVIALFASVASGQTFTNPAQITVPAAGGNADLYPSQIAVVGVAGNIPLTPGAVKVRINNLGSLDPLNLQLVLVGPTGAAFLLQAQAGSDQTSEGIQVYTISDAASERLPFGMRIMDGGVYKPTGYVVPNFPAPGPGTNYQNPGPAAGGGATFASTFGGTAPNGVWRLFARSSSYVQITNGWSITFGQGVTEAYAPSKLSIGAGDDIADDRFGESLDISGSTAIVGAPGENGTRGAAYIYMRGSDGFWTARQKLRLSVGATGDSFGSSVAISGTTAVVGVPSDDIGGVEQGSVYIYILDDNNNWILQNSLTASDGAAGDGFGGSVDISGDRIIVGARFNDAGGITNQGAAYIFTRSGLTWTEQQKLVNPTGAFGDNFGRSVAISGTTAVVGAPSDDTGGTSNHGSAHVFTFSGATWAYQQILIAGDSAASDQLGFSVGIINDLFLGYRVIAGAPGKTIDGRINQGAAYVFRRPLNSTAWTQEQRLTGSTNGERYWFGSSVALSGAGFANGGLAIVGTDRLSFNAPAVTGTASLFRRNGTAWSESRTFKNFDSLEYDVFSNAVAISGDTIFVGAPGKRVSGAQVGAVYTYRVSGRAFDFDEDFKTDVSIYRPGSGEWWYSRSSDAQSLTTQFGASTDRITPGDFTGDGKTDIAFFRPSNGSWFILRSEDSSFFSFPFGASGDIPAPGDYDGDGRTDAAVYRPSSGTWFIRNSSDSGTSIINFGISEDKPVAADYDGDGRADIAIFRPSDGSWWFVQSSTGQFRVFRFGVGTDKPVPGDYSGDGKADLAVFRPSTGFWFVQRSEDNSFYSVPFGASTDIPAPGDYDGDGRFDTAVFRPSTGEWYVQRSTAGTFITSFGGNGDRPVASAFIP